jgi:hypothetical protein
MLENTGCSHTTPYIIVYQKFLLLLVLEEDNDALTHHLPVHNEGSCLFASVSATDCRLIEATPTSRTDIF